MSSDPRPPASTPPAEVIEAAAAAWLSLRERGMTAEQTAEFVRWLQQDPQHVAVFTDLDRVWKDFDRLGAVPISGAAPDADLLAPRVRRRHSRAIGWTALGVAAAVAIGFLAVSQSRTERHTAETAIGAFQKFALPDGSVAQLNTDSAIDVDFTVTQRRVKISRGEVFFNVTKDPARPFIVTSGPVAVRAVGTAFNVHQLGSAVEVLVTEGRVRVDDAREGKSLLPASAGTTEPPLLIAGERAIVPVPAAAEFARPASASIGKIDLPATRRALAWQERRLEFDSVPLSEVVREFNRYNRQQLVIGEASLAARHFSGTFRSDGVESFVRLLEADFGVTATRSDREIVLLVRR